MLTEELIPAPRQVAAAAAVLVVGAGWIHLLAALDHWAHPLVATFFVAVALMQLGWAAFVMYDDRERLLRSGLIGNLGVVLLWVISRTTGLPFVSGASHVEPVGIPDAAASGLELMAATALGLLLIIRKGTRTAPVGRHLVAGAALLTVLLVIVAAAAGTAHTHDQGTEVQHAAR